MKAKTLTDTKYFRQGLSIELIALRCSMEKGELFGQVLDTDNYAEAEVETDILETGSSAAPEEQCLVIDRFEGDIAVCEDRKTLEMININIQQLPAEVKEGDVIKLIDGLYVVDAQETLEIEERIEEKARSLFEE